MSNFNYTNDILKSLKLNSMNGVFFPMPYPHYGCVDCHDSKGIRKIFLPILEVTYRRYKYKH